MRHLLVAGLLLFGALPGTANYQLNSYDFGAAGGTATSTNYALEGSVGSVDGSASSTITYSAKPGYVQTQQANVPKISAFDNASGVYYNKLHFTLDTQSNPTDALYAVSISTDNFVADTRFVKSDLTVGASLTLTDYQTYAAWGGGTGSIIVGLTPGTTYYLRAKATQGKYSESAYGPASSVATASPTITFSVTTTSQASPPFSVAFGTLNAGTITSPIDTINVALDTNAVSGANVYIRGANSGLLSAIGSYTLASATADLAIATEGYGGLNTAIGQTSGGPFSAVSPYNGVAQNVGIIDTTTRSLYTSTAPLIGGTASLTLKAKSKTTSVAASDYQDTITLIAAGSF